METLRDARNADPVTKKGVTTTVVGSKEGLDVNMIAGTVDITAQSTDVSGFVGKASNGDFVTAYASGTTITLSTLPYGVSAIDADDIVSIVQIATDGSVTTIYSRDDAAITTSGTDPTTVTVSGATFVASDTFVVYTNIPRISADTVASEPSGLGNAVGGGGNNTYSNMQGDFTATISNGTKTVTIAGLAFTLEAKHVIAGSVKVTDSNDEVTSVPLTDVAVSSGVITFADKLSDFATGDVVNVTLIGPDKTYDSDLDVTKVIDQAPEWSRYISETLVDDTNISAATVYYPSSTGASMDGYKDFSLSGKLIDADGTITMTVEMMNDEDTTSGDWIQIYGYDDKNNVTTNSWTVTNGTLTFANSFNNANYTNYRVKVIYSGSTNTAIIKQRKKS